MVKNLVEVLREGNLFLGVVTLVWLLNRRIFSRELYKGDVRKDTWIISFCWAAAVITGSIEQLFDTGTFIRVGLATIALLVTVRLLWRKQSEWDRAWLVKNEEFLHWLEQQHKEEEDESSEAKHKRP